MITPLTTSGPARFASLTALMLLMPASEGMAAIPGEQLKALRNTPGGVSAAAPDGRTSDVIHNEMIDEMEAVHAGLTEELSINVTHEMESDLSHSVTEDIEDEVEGMSQAENDKLNNRLLRILKENTIGAGQDG